MPGLDAGAMDRRIRIERATSTDDGYQTRPGDWQPLHTVWAQYKPGRASERAEQASRRAEMSVAFVIRYSRNVADVGTADRVRFPASDDGQLYDIVGRTEIGRAVGIELQCIAVTSGG